MSARHEWLIEPLPTDVAKALKRLERAPGVKRIAVMPDVHLAKEVCIGTVLATDHWIYPAAVGGDAGCGVLAARLSVPADRLQDPAVAAGVLAGFAAHIPVLKHARASMMPADLEERRLSHPSLEREKKRTCRVQLGTIGRGNHFVELQADDENQLWIMIHSGSRGIGTLIRAHHEAQGERVAGGLKRIHADSAEGRAYLADHQWALDYAEANRARILQSALRVLGDSMRAEHVEESTCECHHNFVRAEEHGGEALIVHRKGAISALDGELGIIPGSMGTPSFHVVGRGNRDSMASSSHGAGRVCSRTEARSRISTKNLARQLQNVHCDKRLASRLVDEAPLAYKDIRRVMKAQKNLVTIRRRLRPLLVHKGT